MSSFIGTGLFQPGQLKAGKEASFSDLFSPSQGLWIIESMKKASFFGPSKFSEPVTAILPEPLPLSMTFEQSILEVHTCSIGSGYFLNPGGNQESEYPGAKVHELQPEIPGDLFMSQIPGEQIIIIKNCCDEIPPNAGKMSSSRGFTGFPACFYAFAFDPPRRMNCRNLLSLLLLPLLFRASAV